jgi:gluconate:H+ symporter, GntP family
MSSLIDWLRTSTPGLLVLCGLAIAILLFAIIKVKLEPFIALLLTRLELALAAGLPVKDMSAPRSRAAIRYWRQVSGPSSDTSR